MQRRWIWALVVTAMAAGSAWGWRSYRDYDDRRFRDELRRAEAEIQDRRFAIARKQLRALADRRPDDPEAAFQLGLCAQLLGKTDEAFEAWSRVTVGPGRYQELAAQGRANVLMDRGRFAEAERLLEASFANPGPRVAETRQLLGKLYRWQGRVEEAARLVRLDWDGAADPIAVLKTHAETDLGSWPVAGIRRVLNHAAALAPDDDRVRLGEASLALRLGRHQEAGEALKACRAQRPNDPPVMRRSLDWAMAADDVDSALAALRSLQTADALPILLPVERILGVQAWLARRFGDHAQERQALELRLKANPDSIESIERLVALAAAAGDAATAASLRARKSKLDEAKHAYKILQGDDSCRERPAEMANLAETLGRRFEAQGWRAAAEGRTSEKLSDAPDADREGEEASLIAKILGGFSNRASLAASDANAAKPKRFPFAFADVAEKAGLPFVYQNGKTDRCQLPETMSGGVAVLDFDGDGWLDVYFVQGGTFPPPPSPPCADRLFRNRRDGTFEDATERAGIARMKGGYGLGATSADYDNDGDPDLFVTRWGSYALYRNRGDGTFEDATEETGLGGDRDWPSSAAFADFDNDGDLDLYVCHYLTWDAAHAEICTGTSNGKEGCMYCSPLKYPSRPDRLFRNDGGRFTDVSAASGITDLHGRGLGVVAVDLNGDHLLDIYVANDMTANFLFINKGGMKFEEIGHQAGVAGNADGGYQAGMGIACGDLDGDGRPDLAVTNFFAEATAFYRNLGDGLFADQTKLIGLEAGSRYVLGFGLAFGDFDNDGRLDLLQANGHVNDARPAFPYAMPPQLFAGVGDGTAPRLADASASSGPPFAVPQVSRGLAIGDWNNDGRLDAVIVNQNAPASLLENRTSNPGAFCVVKLRGSKSNRDGVGAVVTTRAGGQTWIAQKFGGGSYLSGHDSRMTIGLGAASQADEIEVRWPSGRVDRWRGLAAGRAWLLREEQPQAEPLPWP